MWGRSEKRISDTDLSVVYIIIFDRQTRNLKRVKQLFIFVFVILSSCKSAEEKERETLIRSSSAKLINSLAAGDTARIFSLFAIDETKIFKRWKLFQDIKNFGIITKKYGMPSLKSMATWKGEDRRNGVSISLISQPDTILRLKSATLHIEFFPDAFMSRKTEILYYDLDIKSTLLGSDLMEKWDSLVLDFTDNY